MNHFQRWVGLLLLIVCVWLLSLLSSLLIPFFIAAFIAYLGDPLVDRLKKLHIPRTVSVLLIFILIFIIIALLLFWLIPLLAKQIGLLLELAPDFLNWVQLTALPWLNKHVGVQEALDVQAVKNTLAANMSKASVVAQWLFTTVSSSSAYVIECVIDVVLVVVVAFYLMRDWDVLMCRISELFPRKIAPIADHLAKQCDDVLSSFLRGQLMIMVVLGVIYAVGLSLIGIHVALLIGVMAGLISVVPYLGTISGLVAAILAAIFQFGTVMPVVWVLIVFAIGHVMEGMVLTPLLIGNRIGLHPVAVIFSVLAGGVLFGFLGVLLALPVAAVIMVFIRYYKERYIQSDYYAKGGQ